MKEKLKKNLPQILIMALFVIVGAVSGLLTMRFMGRAAESGVPKSTSLLASYMLIIVIFLSMAVQIILHEVGHLIFGLIFGYKFRSFRIGSLTLIKKDGKLTYKSVSIAGTGGQCLMAPPEDENADILWYNLGGVILNTVTAVIALILFFIFKDVMFLSESLLMFCMMGLVFALANGLPIKNSLIENDGTNAMSCRKSPAAKKAFLSQMKMAALQHDGVRLKDMPPELFEADENTINASGLEASIAVFKCNRLMDEKQFDEAKKQIDKLIYSENKVVGLHKNLLICDRIYLELITDGKTELIEKLLTKELKSFIKTMKKFPSVIRTEYALQKLFYKDDIKAEIQSRLFEKVALTYPYEAEIASERKLIEYVQTK